MGGAWNERTTRQEMRSSGERDGGRVCHARTRGAGAVGGAFPAGLLFRCVEGERRERSGWLPCFSWWLAFLVSFSFVTCIGISKVAYAGTWDTWIGVIQKQSVIDSSLQESNWGFIVGAGNPYDAAAYACGLSRSTIGAMDLVVRAKLSNPETGGNFYELATVFGNGHITGPGSNVPFWSSTDFIGQLWYVTQGQPPIYVATVSKSFLQAAIRDLNTVLSGGDLGGGSGGSTEVDQLVFEGGVHYQISSSKRGLLYNGTVYYYVTTNADYSNDSVAKLSTPLRLVIPKSCIANFVDAHPLGTYDYSVSIRCLPSGSIDYIKVMATPFGTTELPVATNTVYSSNDYYSNIIWTGTAYSLNLSSGLSYRFDGSTITINSSYVNTSRGSSSQYNGVNFGANNIVLSGGIHHGPVLPPNRWPDEDPQPTPSPPTVPEPDPPTPTPTPDPPVEPTPEPEPNPPVFDPYTPTNPIVYSPVIEPTNTSNTDYTPWLRAIFLQLVNIGSDLVAGLNNIAGALDDHCEHLQDAIGKWVQWLSRSMGTRISNQRLKLQANLQELFDGLHVALADELYDAIYNLELYMKEQMEWLAEQLDFSFTGYDDSSVVSWLRQIYSKLEFDTWHNPVKRPTDPELETGFDWWSWLIDTLVTLLGNGAADTVDTIVGILEEMQRLFPFSIPWDLAAVFAALVAAPLTPVFDVTIPAIDGWWGAVVFHVDLSPYDGAAGVVRSMWVVWFTVVLIMRTDWLVGVFETGARVVTQFLDRL